MIRRSTLRLLWGNAAVLAALLGPAARASWAQVIGVTATVPEQVRLGADPTVVLGPAGLIVSVSVPPQTKSPAYISSLVVPAPDLARLNELLSAKSSVPASSRQEELARNPAEIRPDPAPGPVGTITVIWVVAPQA